MENIDLKTLTNDQLDQFRLNVINELERRQRLLDIPAQVRQLVDSYDHSGGDRAQLVSDITVPADEGLAASAANDTIQDTTNNEETNDGITNSPTGA